MTTLSTDRTLSLPPLGRTMVGGFESTYVPAFGRDSLATTGHDTRWAADLDHLAEVGVRHLRYPLRWHAIEVAPGTYDWAETDRVLGHLQQRGMAPIVDLVHHTSYPDWLSDGFRGPDFGPAYVRYAEAVATRYPWLPAYTLFNEPFATLFLAGHEALWPPYDRGIEGFVRLLRSVLPAMSEAGRCWAELLPQARHVWVDTAEHHTGAVGHEDHAAMANDRRHVVLDLYLGHQLHDDRPFLSRLLAAGGEDLLQLAPGRVDLLGLDYYCHSEWFYDDEGARAPSPVPLGLAAIIEQYGERYDLPMMVTETNIRGLETDRASWLRYMLQEYDTALSRGARLHGLCWFPHVDSTDWDTLLARFRGRPDPVGVLSVGEHAARRRTAFTAAWEAAARGEPTGRLPAYRFQQPCAQELTGYLPHLEDWPWQDPSGHDVVPPLRLSPGDGASGQEQPDLVVLSHLRWPWVWQRPQHVVSRLAAARAEHGARTWFVEEPVSGEVVRPEIRQESLDGITRLWLVVPRESGMAEHLGFDDPAARDYGTLLARLLQQAGRPAGPDVWLYTPMALDIAQRLQGGRLVYDVMDDLASFAQAPDGLRLRQRRLLADADLVFTGGRSLHRGVVAQRAAGVHLFPSGVDTGHYASSRALRRAGDRHVAGYVGVIDVALMPFALNEATKSISPTKTLEYLAAGLPVVATRVPDVVEDYDQVVHLADDGEGFAQACRAVLHDERAARDRRVRPIQERQEWTVIAGSMGSLLDAVPRRGGTNVDSAGAGAAENTA
jgi:beta-glucosidase/6-phospho-beta-glucosidase/beta-galactosidase